MSKRERKVVEKFALETQKLMHSICPIDKANKKTPKTSNNMHYTCKTLW